MLKKTNNHTKTGNIAKIKYFLPSSSENRDRTCQNQSSKLNQLKRSINNKYRSSYSNSKLCSKQHSVNKFEPQGESLNSQINLNDDVSFEIVNIRDAQENEAPKCRQIRQIRDFLYPFKQIVSHVNQRSNSRKGHSENCPTFRKQAEKYPSSKYSIPSNIPKASDFQKIAKSFPPPEEKAEFQTFLQDLKKDQNYQNTITMFTVMYFYEQKAKKR